MIDMELRRKEIFFNNLVRGTHLVARILNSKLILDEHLLVVFGY